MKLGGYRTDGTLRVLIPGGMTVLLHGDVASPPMDDRDADAYGPWMEPPVSLTWQERQTLGKRLDRAQTVPLHTFNLKFPAKKTEVAGEVEGDGDGDAPADTAVAAPTAELTKGDILARITEIAAAQAKARDEEKAKADAKPADTPRHSLKRLKLEFESEDHHPDADDKKPVSEVATPDHLKPMETQS